MGLISMLQLLLLLPCIVVVVLAALAAIHVAYVLLRRRKPNQTTQSCRSSLPAAPPGPAGLPLIGNAVTFFGLLRRNPHRALARLAGTYGPIFSFRPGRTCTFVVLSSPALAREALAEKEAALAARFVPDSVRALGYGAGSMAFVPSSDPRWKRHRATVGAFLTSTRGPAATRRVRDRHACRLAARLRARSGRPVRVGEAVFAAANNVISNILFSEDVVGGAGNLQSGVFERVVGALFEEWAKPNVPDAFPFLAPLDLFGSRRRTSRNLAQLYELFHGVIDRRLAGGERTCSSARVRRATSPRNGPWRTCSGARTMERLRAEIAASLGAKEFVEEGDLGSLPYLHAVVKETLRLHPAVPVVTREVAASGGVSLGGFPVAAGTCVLVNLWAIGTCISTDDETVHPRITMATRSDATTLTNSSEPAHFRNNTEY
ncbi:cytochrome P450 76M5-like [Panicum virgatum]|uniref:cytochrome P450 76M5-like n=1 Tax=Panicum virgatum TaxID=38727 RepID=UPI0019D530DA|nr:cytochrome P450 76M5-like [Panicum virgatum]